MNVSCWLVHGRIKEKISTIYAIEVSCVLYEKYSTVSTVGRNYSRVILILVCYQCSKQPPLIIFAHLCGFLTLLKWSHKGNSKEANTKGIIWNHSFFASGA